MTAGLISNHLLWRPNLRWSQLQRLYITLKKMKVQRKYQNSTFWTVSPKLRDLLVDYNARDEVDLRTDRRTYQNWINYGFTWERKKILEELIFTWANWEICGLQWGSIFVLLGEHQSESYHILGKHHHESRKEQACSFICSIFFCYCCWVWRQAPRKMKT